MCEILSENIASVCRHPTTWVLGAGERQRNQVCRWPCLASLVYVSFTKSGSPIDMQMDSHSTDTDSDKRRATGISALFIPQLFALTLYTPSSLLGHSLPRRVPFKIKKVFIQPNQTFKSRPTVLLICPALCYTCHTSSEEEKIDTLLTSPIKSKTLKTKIHQGL